MNLTSMKDFLYQVVLWMIVIVLSLFGLALAGFVFKFFYNVWMFGWSMV